MPEEFKIGIQVDEPTVNGRVYPRAVMEAAIEEFLKKEARFVVLGSPSLEVRVSDATHTVDNLRIDEEGFVIASITSLDTDSNNVYKQTKDMLTLTSCSIGTMSEDLVLEDGLFISHFAFYKEPYEYNN